MPTPIRPDSRNRAESASSGGASATIIRAEVKAEDHISAKASPIAIARRSIPGPFRRGQRERPPRFPVGDPIRTVSPRKGAVSDQTLTLSFSALTIVTLTCLSAGLVMVSPVAGLRT